VRSASTNGLSCRCSRELAGYRGVLPQRISQISLSFSYGRPGQEHRVCGVGGRTEALGRLTASVCKSGPLGDSAAVRRSDRQGGYVDMGRSKLAGAVSSLFEMCLWVAGRCNENLAYAPPAFPLRAVRQDMAITDAYIGISIAIRVSRQRKSCGLDKAL